MTAKVFTLDTKPGIQRDGTVFDKEFYTDGLWVRFQRGRPRKIRGYKQISADLIGPSRGIWVNAQDNFTSIFSGHSDGLQTVVIDENGIGTGATVFTLNSFTASALNLWQFDGFYNREGAVNTVVAHPGQNLVAIDSTTNTPVLFGNIAGSTLLPIGVFTIAATLATSTTVTVANTDLIGVGQVVTGTGIPASTTVTSVINATSFTISNAATITGASTLTIDNEVSVSGGVVVLHPFVFVYGNDGFIRNCAAGDPDDWVSAEANETNVATGKIVQGLPVRGGSNAPSGLFWSIDSLIRVSYIGGVGTPPAFWRYDIITSQTSILSSQCAIEYDGIYYWIAVDRFMLYNGVAKEVPNSMNQNYFFDNLNYAQRQKVWATKVPRFGEIWWFYPRGDATECTDAIIYNVREGTWYDAGEANGARRSAGYFSQVFQYPVNAGWDVIPTEIVFSASYALISGNATLTSDTYNGDVELGQVVTGASIPSNTVVNNITSSGIKTLGAITGGSLYTNGTYTNVALTGGTGFGARATIVVAGAAVTTVTITTLGAGYIIGDVLSATAATIGGTGSGFSVPITAIWTQIITLSQAATATVTETLTFSTPEDRINLWQHELGTDAIIGDIQNAIDSYFETNNLGWVSGGPSESGSTGDNIGLHIERIEPDFIMTGEMEMYVYGRPFAQSEDIITGPYFFDQTTGRIDLREQRRELRLRFRSNVQGGNYQLGRLLLNADTGDVRPY
jgi:hypothetical protein